jgi:hypothetical protein
VKIRDNPCKSVAKKNQNENYCLVSGGNREKKVRRQEGEYVEHGGGDTRD